MTVTILLAGGKPVARLTTEHSQSSYGQPVMLYDGQAYGECDVLPTGQFAGRLVQDYIYGDTPPDGCEWGSRSPRNLALARKFCRSLPGQKVTIYVKPEDIELFGWAKKRRAGLSETIAQALIRYRQEAKS